MFIKWLRRLPLNIRALKAKIKIPKRSSSLVTVWIELRRTYQNFSSQADPVREK